MKKITISLLVLLVLSFLVDDKLSLLLNSARSGFLDFFMVWFYLIFGSLIILILMSLILYKDRNKLYLMWGAFFSTGFLHVILKFFIGRVRPFVALNLDKISGINYDFAFWNTAFPSWHTAAVFLLFPYIYNRDVKIKLVWLIFALLASFNRLYLGLHYLSDVIAGMIVGLLMGYLFIYLDKEYKIVKRLRKNFKFL